ncbi:Type-2 restriction enzyme AplI [Myxococcaceae bacterium]|jgi:adenine-specific DNA-methyltransferase|nr:Type-2 restriction enzyme AplI [Myxococcaceae bacterium]
MAQSALTESSSGLLDHADFFRVDASRRLDPGRRSEMGQFLTPAPVARFMASMFAARPDEIRLLDPGAGTGSLTAAFVEQACEWRPRPARIIATVYELDPDLVRYLDSTLQLCARAAADAGIEFEARINKEDFVEAASTTLEGGLFAPKRDSFNAAILNPPYRKIHSESQARRLISTIGIETSNLYTAFLALTLRLLDRGGEMVAISPRSFCNGPYFRSFRELLLSQLVLRRIHVFESRDRAFGDDDVLQENMIIAAVKDHCDSGEIVISSSTDVDDPWLSVRSAKRDQIVRPGDPERFIRLITDNLDQAFADRMSLLTASLSDLGIDASTGRVVDFRARENLRAKPARGTAPLIHPAHFSNGFIDWPRPSGKKANAIAVGGETRALLLPEGTYVLVKRFSAKEEPRRIVAAVYDPKRIGAGEVGFENHLNVFHRKGAGLPPELARGLAAFLNSTLVDVHFRQFSGHTQVNATDLRSLRYPSREALEALGRKVGEEMPDQDGIDRLVREEVFPVAGPDPVQAKRKIDQALSILKSLGLPRAQQNERSALTLLALLDLKPDRPWSKASNPMRGITPMMDFFEKHYGKKYAPNTRETVRRQSVHQFLDAGFIVQNPDDPDRATNSAKNVYQIVDEALAVFRSFGTRRWEAVLAEHISGAGTLKQRYDRPREMKRVPVRLPSGKAVRLSPGGQNPLLKAIVEELCPRFAAGGHVLYVGDTDEKWATFERAALAELGVVVGEHGKMPDVVVHHIERNWLLLIEAVTSHGPVSAKRRGELGRLFRGSKAGLVYVTAFLDRKTLVRFLGEISWETEVWVAESPTHMIHFNGERFLGPYESAE